MLTGEILGETGISALELKRILGGEPAAGMPAQAASLGGCDATPDPAHLQMHIEALTATLFFMRNRFENLLTHLQLTDRNI